MEKQNFEDFLKTWHARDYHGTDDDMPDAFEKWVSEIQVDYIIKLADLAIREAEIRGINRGGELALNAFKTNS